MVSIFAPKFGRSPRGRIPAEGPTNAKVVIVGEAPGAHEEKLGLPFVGKAGAVLDQCLNTGGLLRSRVYITNVVKERPLGNNIDPYFDERTMRFTELGRPWMEELRAELAKLKANVIVPLGNVALAAVVGEAPPWRINRIRGYIVEGVTGHKVIPTIHPASVLYGSHRKKKTGDTEERTSPYIQRYYIANDLKKAAAESLFPEIRRPARDILIPDSLKNAVEWLDYFNTCKRLSIDIEVVNFEVSCICFADSPDRCMSIPFYNNVWNEDEEMILWLAVARILGNKRIHKIFQNGIFDVHFLLTRCSIMVEPLTAEMYEDTMIAHSIMYPEMLKGLGFLTSMYCGSQEYYKNMVKFDNIKEAS